MRKQLSVAIPIEVNHRLASYFVDRVYNLLRIIGDAQEGGQSLHYQHLTFGKHDRFRLSFLRFHKGPPVDTPQLAGGIGTQCTTLSITFSMSINSD